MVGALITLTVTAAICSALVYVGPEITYAVFYMLVVISAALIFARMYSGERTIVDAILYAVTGTEYHSLGRRYKGTIATGRGYVYDESVSSAIPVHKGRYIVTARASSGRKYNGLYYGPVDNRTSCVIIKGRRVTCLNSRITVKREATRSDRIKHISSIGV